MQIKYTSKKPTVEKGWWQRDQMEHHLAEYSGQIHIVWTGDVSEEASLSVMHKQASSSNVAKAILYLDYRGNLTRPGFDEISYNSERKYKLVTDYAIVVKP